MPEIYHWAQLFKATTWEEIRMLAEKNESIKKSIVTLKELTADEQAKMQMEARERYRRDMVAALDFVREEKDEEIKALKDDLQQVQEESAKFQKESARLQEENVKFHEESARLQEENAKFHEESIKKDERIRFLEEQLARMDKE